MLILGHNPLYLLRTLSLLLHKSKKKSKKVVDRIEGSVIIFILSMRIGEDNENIRRRSKDVKKWI
jgi:hypothetical protein